MESSRFFFLSSISSFSLLQLLDDPSSWMNAAVLSGVLSCFYSTVLCQSYWITLAISRRAISNFPRGDAKPHKRRLWLATAGNWEGRRAPPLTQIHCLVSTTMVAVSWERVVPHGPFPSWFCHFLRSDWHYRSTYVTICARSRSRTPILEQSAKNLNNASDFTSLYVFE